MIPIGYLDIQWHPEDYAMTSLRPLGEVGVG